MVKHLQPQERRRRPNAASLSKASRNLTVKTHNHHHDSLVAETTCASAPIIQKQYPCELDSGRCLITQELHPLISIHPCHVLHRHTQLKPYEKAWKTQNLDIDSRLNLVSLKADWREAYDAGCWVFVPTLDVLMKMIATKGKGTFENPYSGYNAGDTIDYVLVVLPGLGQKVIFRLDHNLEDFQAYHARDNFAGFPVLRSHVHPYFVIANALPKLEAIFLALKSEHRVLAAAMRLIADKWGVLPYPRRPKRRRAASGRGGGPRKRRNPYHDVDADGKRKLNLSGLPQQDSCPSPPLSARSSERLRFYFDDKAHILAWINTVLAAGPAEQVPQDVIEPDGERACPPFEGNWHDWCYPWTKPADNFLFCSADWAMYLRTCKLTRSPACWEFSDVDDSDEEDASEDTTQSVRQDNPPQGT